MADRQKLDAAQDAMSSALLMNVIRTLTTSVSDDQRELESSRLKKGYEQSGLVIDKLLNEHRSDVNHCLSSFREVSNGITAARERIKNGKNALDTCKTLLQCRKDDLKKLWKESAEQAQVNTILQQIHEIKHLDKTVEASLQDSKYRKTVDILKKADILLNGPLSEIDGLSQLRSNISDTSQSLFERMVTSLLDSVIVVPFDSQIFELMKGLNEQTLNESPICVDLFARYYHALLDPVDQNSSSSSKSSSQAITNMQAPPRTPTITAPLVHRVAAAMSPGVQSSGGSGSGRRKGASGSENLNHHLSLASTHHPPIDGGANAVETIRREVAEIIDALGVFDQLDSAVEQFFLRANSLCQKCVNATIDVMRLTLRNVPIGDSSHLGQLVQVLVTQMRKSADRLTIFAEGVGDRAGVGGPSKTKETISRFWELLQSVMESTVSDHLDIRRRVRNGGMLDAAAASSGDLHGIIADADQKKRTPLFSFENTTFVSSANSSLLKKKQRNLICPASPYNITAIYHLLNRFASEIEKQVATEKNPQCRLTTFFHSFVMDSFVERVRIDMEGRMEQALVSSSGDGVWSSLSSLPAHNVHILTSAIRVLEMAKQINDFISTMGAYSQRFASLWLLILTDYTKSAADMYAQIIRTRGQHAAQSMGEDDVSVTENIKISASWAADEDINRLLKSMPSWVSISQMAVGSPGTEQASTMAGHHDPSSRMAGGGGIASEQETRLRTVRESELLIGNLGSQKQIQRSELITDMEHIRALACTHESLQWFCFNMRGMIAALSAKAKEALNCRIQISHPAIGQSIEKRLDEAIEERLVALENMSETCLLMEHLELRVHCFFQLLPLAHRRGAAPQDEQDREVSDFGRDLAQLHQTLSKYMAPHKLKYLFDGLGYLCASIFIHSSQYMTKLTESDRKRVCRNIFTVQKYISQLSGRPEAEMNRALTFFKLVTTVDIHQIFALIKESGESYSYLEYTYLLALAVRSHPTMSNQPGALESVLNQLRDNLLQMNKK